MRGISEEKWLMNGLSRYVWMKTCIGRGNGNPCRGLFYFPCRKNGYHFYRKGKVLGIGSSRGDFSTGPPPCTRQIRGQGVTDTSQGISLPIRVGRYRSVVLAVEDLVGYVLRAIVIFKYASTMAEELSFLEAKPLHLIRREVSSEDKTESDQRSG